MFEKAPFYESPGARSSHFFDRSLWRQSTCSGRVPDTLKATGERFPSRISRCSSIQATQVTVYRTFLQRLCPTGSKPAAAQIEVVRVQGRMGARRGRASRACARPRVSRAGRWKEALYLSSSTFTRSGGASHHPRQSESYLSFSAFLSPAKGANDASPRHCCCPSVPQASRRRNDPAKGSSAPCGMGWGLGSGPDHRAL